MQFYDPRTPAWSFFITVGEDHYRPYPAFAQVCIFATKGT